MRLLLLVLLAVTASHAINITIPIVPITIDLPDLDKLNIAKIAEMFAKFIIQFGKTYANKEAREKAMKVFGDNVRTIIQLNTEAAKDKLVEYGINQFSDLTDEEFANQYLMSKADEPDIPIQNDTIFNLMGTSFGSAPASYDWRANKNMVGSVKNQGTCGCCWAFAAAAVATSAYGMRNKKLVEVSEQQICDCVYDEPGCGGGSSWDALEYVIDHGATKASGYPAYTPARSAKTGVCAARGRTVDVRLRNLGRLKGATAMRDTMYVTGPIAAAYAISQQFRHYKSGIFTNTDCNYSSKIKNYHAVAIVGYGSQNGVNFWIAKNSFSAAWGEGGYFRIQRGTNLCGIESRGSYYATA